MELKRGDRGKKVRVLQRALQRAGFDLREDGDFRGITETAVKAFQKRQSLKVDGIAGRQTLTALGLDPTTLEETGGEGEVSTITFTEADLTVPTFVDKRIRDYVDSAIEQRRQILETLQNALHNFQTTMSFASTKEAKADVLGAYLSKAYQFVLDDLVRMVPVLDEGVRAIKMVKTLFTALTEELERAGRARDSASVATWIKRQRSALDDIMQKNTKQKNKDRDELVHEIRESYLDLDLSGRRTFVEQLDAGLKSFGKVESPSIHVLEQMFYEQWINAHFVSTGEDAIGCIESRVDSEDGKPEFVSCIVKAPLGDKIEDALNELMNDPGTRVSRPLDFLVHKRVCFYVQNRVGGTEYSCGWLDEGNDTLHTPSLPQAKKAFDDRSRWESAVERFQRAD